MFDTFRTLIVGANARAEERLRDIYSIELIEQKIREAGQSLKSAKVSLAGLIQRKRAEERQADALQTRIDDLGARIKEAIKKGEKDLAREAAEAIAVMETESHLRQETIRRLETRIVRLENSVETAHRRLTDLKQGAVAARAIRQEQKLQQTLGNTGAMSQGAMDEAEELIQQVMQRDDPFEKSEILREIDATLNHDTVADRMAAKGLGPSTRVTADDVLARYK